MEAALAAGVAGDAALLLDDDQDRVAVAVEPDLAHALDVPRLLALVPQLPARARPVVHLARGGGALERVAVHPREGEHLAGVRVLGDRRRQPVGVPADGVEPRAHRGFPDLDAGRRQRGLRRPDAVLAVVEDRRGEHGVGAADDDPVDEILQRPDAAGRDHRDVDRVDDRPRQRQVEAGAGAVAVHAGQQDLAGAARHDLARPGDGVEPGRRAAAVGEHLPGLGRGLLGVDRGDDALRRRSGRPPPRTAPGGARPRC